MWRCLIGLILWMPAAAPAAAPCVAACTKLESLQDFSRQTIRVPENHPLLVTFFYEDCVLCQVQFRETACIEALGVGIAYVGVGHDKARLRQKLGSTQSSLGNFVISEKRAKSWKIAGTPWHWLYQNGRIAPMAGLITCQEFSQLVH